MKRLLIAGTAALALTACGASETESPAAEAAKVVDEAVTPKFAPDSPAALGSAWLAENAKKEDVVTTDSGLQYKVVQAGLENGATAAPGQSIAAHYHGMFIDGEVFDSSYNRGQPLIGPSNGFITGWNEALGEMKVCEARTLYINSGLAYGDSGRGGIPGGATLLFHMQLLAVNGSDEGIAYECPQEKILANPEAY